MNKIELAEIATIPTAVDWRGGDGSRTGVGPFLSQGHALKVTPISDTRCFSSKCDRSKRSDNVLRRLYAGPRKLQWSRRIVCS
jgi:hypothetical protein